MCAYCGHKTGSLPSASPTDSFELQSPNLSFQTCNHHLDLQALKDSDYPRYLRTLYGMVSQQISAIEEIEAILERKKASLVARVKEFVELNTPKLADCARAALGFQTNFARLSELKVAEPFTAWIRPDLASYFDGEKLVGWADKCLQNARKIQKKIQAFEREFFPEFLKQLDADATALDDACQSLKSRFAIHRRLLEADVMAADQSAHHQKTIEDIFEKLNADAKAFIREKSEKLNLLLKKTNTRLTQSIFLVTENVAELGADVKVLSVFEQMDAVVAQCIQEMTLRANFETVYRGLIALANSIAQKENERRTAFVGAWGERIPSQMFPDIRQHVKLINEDLLFKDGLSSRMGKSLLSADAEAQMRGVAEVVWGLV